MDESHEGYKLLRGVRIDVKRLLTEFEKTGSVRFTDFCTEWKKMKFSLIFCERRNLAELLEFSEEVIEITKGYLKPPWNFHIRVGALFTLYGLFYKQPIMRAAKIRFTLEEWEHVCQFIKECKDAKHYDVCFVHYKMFIQGAYVFTITPRATGLERGFRKYDIKKKGTQNYLSERILQRSDIIDPGLLDSLVALESVYTEKKTEVLGSQNLEFIDNSFAANLKTRVEKFLANVQQNYPSRNLEAAMSSNVASHSLGLIDDDGDEAAGTSSEAPPEEKPCETIFEKEMKLRKEGLTRGSYRKRARSKSPDTDSPDKTVTAESNEN